MGLRVAVLTLLMIAGTAAHAQRPEDPGYQDWWAKLHGLDAARAKSVEAATAEALHLRQLLLKEFAAGRKPMPKVSAELTNIYASSLYHAYNNLRISLGERGIRIPTVAWDLPDVAGMTEGAGGAGAAGGDPGASGRGGTTQRMGAAGRGGTTQPLRGGTGQGQNPGGRSAAASMLPTVLVMSAAEYKRCTTSEGKTWETCATEFATKAVTGGVVGGLVSVVCAVSPLAGSVLPPVFTAVFVVSSGLTLIDLVEEAGENVADDAARRRNETRLNAAKIAAIEKIYADRLKAAAIPAEYGSAIDREVEALAAIVKRAREDQAKFRALNDQAKIAATACADKAQVPEVLAANAVGLVTKMKPLADAIERRTRDARTLVVPCAGAQSAHGALAMLADAGKDNKTLGEMSVDARRYVSSAMQFFATLKAGREASKNAALELAKLESRIEEARRAQSAIYAAVTLYEGALAKHTAARREVYMHFRTLKNALPASPSAATADMLKRLDDGLVRSQASALTTDRLNEIRFKVVDEISRVTGLHRTAAGERAALTACANWTDTVPEPMRQLLGTLGEDITSLVLRASNAMRDAASLQKPAEDCANAKPKGRDTRFAGTMALWIIYSVGQPEVQLGTMVLRDIDQQRGRTLLTEKLGNEALIDSNSCGAGAPGARTPKPGQEYYEGEITWMPNPFITMLNRRPDRKTPMVNARVVACSSVSSPEWMTARFSGTEGRGGFFQLMRQGRAFLKDRISFDRGMSASLFVRVQ